MTAPLIVRPLEPTDHSSLFAFYRANLGTGERVAQYFEWRERDPASGGNRPFAAWYDGALLGTVNVVPWTLAGGGHEFSVCWQQDSIVSAAARGKGVGKALVNAAAAGWPLVLAKGTSAAMYALRKSAGFVDLPNATYLTRALRPFATGGTWRRRLGTPLLSFRNLFHRLPPPSRPLHLRELSTFGPSYDALAARLVGGQRMAPRKGASYLHWRYLGCPTRQYRILEAVDGEEPLGAAILRLPSGPPDVAWLVDLIGDLDDADVVVTLLSGALRSARAAGASLIRTFATSQRAREFLGRAGFVDSAETPRFTIRVGLPTWTLGPDRIDWNFWHGDGDAELYQ